MGFFEYCAELEQNDLLKQQNQIMQQQLYYQQFNQQAFMQQQAYYEEQLQYHKNYIKKLQAEVAELKSKLENN